RLAGADAVLARIYHEHTVSKSYTPLLLGEILAARTWTSGDELNRLAVPQKEAVGGNLVATDDKKPWEPRGVMSVLDGLEAVRLAWILTTVGDEGDVNDYIAWWDRKVRARTAHVENIVAYWTSTATTLAMELRQRRTFKEAMATPPPPPEPKKPARPQPPPKAEPDQGADWAPPTPKWQRTEGQEGAERPEGRQEGTKGAGKGQERQRRQDEQRRDQAWDDSWWASSSPNRPEGRSIIVLSAFDGIGASHWLVAKAFGRPLLSVSWEGDGACKALVQKAMPWVEHRGDLTRDSPEDVAHLIMDAGPDACALIVWCAAPPCQDFSRIGQGAGHHGERGRLFQDADQAVGGYLRLGGLAFHPSVATGRWSDGGRQYAYGTTSSRTRLRRQAFIRQEQAARSRAGLRQLPADVDYDTALASHIEREFAEQRAMGSPMQQPAAAASQATQADRASGPRWRRPIGPLAGSRWWRTHTPVHSRRPKRAASSSSAVPPPPKASFPPPDMAGGATALAARNREQRSHKQASSDEFRFQVCEPAMAATPWAANSCPSPRTGGDGRGGGEVPRRPAQAWVSRCSWRCGSTCSCAWTSGGAAFLGMEQHWASAPLMQHCLATRPALEPALRRRWRHDLCRIRREVVAEPSSWWRPFQGPTFLSLLRDLGYPATTDLEARLTGPCAAPDHWSVATAALPWTADMRTLRRPPLGDCFAALSFAICQVDENGDLKLRRSEDWRRSGHNATMSAEDVPTHHFLGDIVDFILAAWCEGWDPKVFGHDLQNAYRQWAVRCPGHCGTFLPTDQGVTLWFHYAMCFGAAASVWNFNRAADAVQMLMRALLLVILGHFVDDFNGADDGHTAESAHNAVAEFFAALGLHDQALQ
ncbi:PUB3, partial [Symbiodinium sp. CCMP2456]